jgi:hypothetical protein
MEHKAPSPESAELILSNLLSYSDRNGRLLQKYNLDFYLTYFDRAAIMQLAATLPPHQPLTQHDFIRVFLLQIEHSPDQTLYLALSLKALFHAILERTLSSSLTIEFSDFTNYLCEVPLPLARKYLRKISTWWCPPSAQAKLAAARKWATWTSTRRWWSRRWARSCRK